MATNHMTIDALPIAGEDGRVLIHAHKLVGEDVTSAASLSLSPEQARDLGVILALVRETPQLFEGLAKLTTAAEVAELESALATPEAAA